ncbi:PTB domain-containing engulfment adapter protein 1 [Geodia barretti]|uniref:PTB domain-containing engulfment adapter protein 1 n=1 Tax=Geodia barretti TaxID=519541 RepID=A0AA35RMI5_GEOBA|nr:PTB domain-containing engulfment adapter protein 1 [Geodia barretti]
MTGVNTEYIIAIALGSVLVTLLLVFMCLLCVFLRKKRALCFHDHRGYEQQQRPFVIPDKTLEERYGKKQRRRKGGSPEKGAKRKPVQFSRIGQQSPNLRQPRGDPFAHNYLEDPMLDEEAMGEDWSNPLFDAERSQKRDAAIHIQSWFRMIRVRIPFLQLRDAVILCQALYRGRVARRLLPQWRRDKQIKDQQRKKIAGWKKKGTLSALKFYEVKGYGFAEVEQLYGLETMRSAADQLKKLYGGKGKMRLKIFISVKGIKLCDHHTRVHFATVKISSVSFCTLDPKNKKLFAFINRKKRRNFCHVFQCNEHDAQKMVETMAEAFEVTFKQLEQKRQKIVTERSRESRLSQRPRQLNRVTKEEIQHQSQELDIEVASMMEMAETASSTNAPIASHKQENATRVESHFTDTKNKMKEMSQDLESHS